MFVIKERSIIRNTNRYSDVILTLPPLSLYKNGALDQYYHKDIIKDWLAQKESIMGGINILLRPAPTLAPFNAWKPPLCHKDTRKEGVAHIRGLWVP